MHALTILVDKPYEYSYEYIGIYGAALDHSCRPSAGGLIFQ